MVKDVLSKITSVPALFRACRLGLCPEVEKADLEALLELVRSKDSAGFKAALKPMGVYKQGHIARARRVLSMLLRRRDRERRALLCASVKRLRQKVAEQWTPLLGLWDIELTASTSRVSQEAKYLYQFHLCWPPADDDSTLPHDVDADAEPDRAARRLSLNIDGVARYAGVRGWTNRVKGTLRLARVVKEGSGDSNGGGDAGDAKANAGETKWPTKPVALEWSEFSLEDIELTQSLGEFQCILLPAKRELLGSGEIYGDKSRIKFKGQQRKTAEGDGTRGTVECSDSQAASASDSAQVAGVERGVHSAAMAAGTPSEYGRRRPPARGPLSWGQIRRVFIRDRQRHGPSRPGVPRPSDNGLSS